MAARIKSLPAYFLVVVYVSRRGRELPLALINVLSHKLDSLV